MGESYVESIATVFVFTAPGKSLALTGVQVSICLALLIMLCASFGIGHAYRSQLFAEPGAAME
jgi:hypothetical protein